MYFNTLLICQVLTRLAQGATTFYDQAVELMEEFPLLDTHIDLPQIIRSLNRKPLDVVAQLNGSFPGHVDIPRMRQGRLGGAFWTVWAPCYDVVGEDPGPDFNTPTNHLRDSLEMLDLIQNMVAQNSADLQYARSSADIWEAFHTGKIASLIGMEGTHLLGNSLSTVRIFAQLGVRYLTLTHTCHSAFASSVGSGTPLGDVHEGNGLSELGKELVGELNRVGIMVDLSHTTDATMKQAIALSEAPVVWTHAGARALWDHPRNVPDDVLNLIGDGPGKKDGVIQSVFFPHFIGPYPGANVSHVADHIEHIAGIVGRNRVGIASDFDGMYLTVSGLEDATKYPNLVAELLSRGWSREEMRGVLGGNLMRVMDKVDAVSEGLRNELPSSAIWEARMDLPSKSWGGGGVQVYWPEDVKAAVDRMEVQHDEL
ncbi:Fc.00g046360.m01.CDS01 [Cosmosporella sp. VM-42]